MEITHRQPSAVTSDPVTQMSEVEERARDRSMTTRTAASQIDEEADEEEFEPPHEKSNEEDPERRSKEFRARHIQMMALGASIGSGLLFQSGKGLWEGGPVALWLAYVIMATVLYSVLITLGEMISFLPIPGGFFTLAKRVLSPAIGFGCGWAYWAAYIFGLPAQLVAASKIMAFWLPDLSPAIWISVFIVLPIIFNNFNVRRYGEIEYWLTVTKIVTIVGLIVLGILLPMGASPNQRLLGTFQDNSTTPAILTEIVCPTNPGPGDLPCVGTPGFEYWREGAFREYLVSGAAGRLLGFWACCCQAIFSFAGTELIGIAADETERQRQTLPKAVRRVSYRLAFYYIGGVIVLGLNLSATDPVLVNSMSNSGYLSPFVIMVRRAGIPKLEHVINAVALIAVISVSNANLYVSSRTLYALAKEGMAPKIFETKNRWDVPWLALAVSALPAALAYMSVNTTSVSLSPNDVYDFLAELTVTIALIPWAIICATYLRFRRAVKKQSMRRAIPQAAVSPLQPYLAIYGLVWCIILIIFQGFEVFARHNVIWSFISSSWGFTLAPWMSIAAFCLLVSAWLIRTRVLDKEWTLATPRLGRVDLHNGVAPMVDEPTKSKNKFIRTLMVVLDKI